PDYILSRFLRMASSLPLAARALAVFCFALIADTALQDCSNNEQRLIKAPTNRPRNDFCIQKATQLRPAWMRQLADGSCQLLCAKNANSDGAPLLYRRMPPGSPSLLLRCRADQSCDPYSLLAEEKSNTTLADDTDLKDSKDAYKSPMIGLQPTAFSHIHLLLMNAAGHIDVNLTFKMRAGGRLQEEGAWFSINNLVSAYPFNVTVMKAYTSYSYFNMSLGVNSHIRFYIRTQIPQDKCPYIAGYLLISKSKCPFANGKPQTYIWTKGNEIPEERLFATKSQHAEEFRLYGTMLDNYTPFEKLKTSG
ncbi:MAG: hypothetical protein AAGK05_12770, partial [Pseudomonadota bacterium]